MSTGIQIQPAAAVHFKCPHCAVLLGVSEAQARSGVQGPCPICGGNIPAETSRLVAAELTPQASNPAASSQSGRLRSLFTYTAVIALVAGSIPVGVSIWLAIRHLPRTAGGPAPLARSSASRGDENDACKALGAFLECGDWQTRRDWVIDPGRCDRLAPNYYAGRDPDEVFLRDFSPCVVEALAGRSDIRTFQATRAGRRPVLAILKSVEQRWKLDWETFVQTYDESFDQFLHRPDHATKTFRARVERVFGEVDGPAAFRVAVCDELDPGQRVEVDLPTGSLLRDKVATGLVGKPSRPGTVTMDWHVTTEGQWQPALRDVICWGWLGVTEQPAGEVTPLPGKRRVPTPAVAAAPGQQPVRSAAVAQNPR